MTDVVGVGAPSDVHRREDVDLVEVTEGAGGGIQIIDLTQLPTSVSLANTWTGVLTATNRANQFAGSFAGDGGGHVQVPSDQLARHDYPAILVTTGLWDSQVQYFEPAKWVARLRRLNTGREPIVFHVNMEAGHGGRSGRFQRYREIALEYSWALQTLGVTDASLAAVAHGPRLGRPDAGPAPRLGLPGRGVPRSGAAIGDPADHAAPRLSAPRRRRRRLLCR